MDDDSPWEPFIRAVFAEIDDVINRRLRAFRDLLDQWLNDLLAGVIRDNWREQLDAFVAQAAAQGVGIMPGSVELVATTIRRRKQAADALQDVSANGIRSRSRQRASLPADSAGVPQQERKAAQGTAEKSRPAGRSAAERFKLRVEQMADALERHYEFANSPGYGPGQRRQLRDYLARQMLFELALRRASGNPRSVANPIADPRLKQLLQQAPQAPAFLSEARDKEDAERREAARSPQMSAISEADYRASGTLWRLGELSKMIAGGVAMSPAERQEYEDIVNAQVFGAMLKEGRWGFVNPAFAGFGNFNDMVMLFGGFAPGPGTRIDRLGVWRAGEPSEGARTELVQPRTPETFLDKVRKVPGSHSTNLVPVPRTLQLPTSSAASNSAARQFWTETTEFQGAKVYQRGDLINPSLTDSMGRTNLQRMQAGRAPIGPDGESLHLHHMFQTQDSPLAETTQTFHQQNSSTIHINPNTLPSGINRPTFNAFRGQYWTNRAQDFGGGTP